MSDDLDVWIAAELAQGLTLDPTAEWRDSVARRALTLLQEHRTLLQEHRAALRKLVDRLDFVHADPDYGSVWFVNQNHTGPYRGPTYIDELAYAREVLAGEVQDG